jgi:hypothetical protein
LQWKSNFGVHKLNWFHVIYFKKNVVVCLEFQQERFELIKLHTFCCNLGNVFFNLLMLSIRIASISLHYSSCNKLLDYFIIITQCPWSSKDRATFYPTLQICLYNYVTTSYALAHILRTWWRAEWLSFLFIILRT